MLVTMKKIKVWRLFGLLLPAVLMSHLSNAQESTKPSDAPPKLEKLEEGEPPSIKIGKPEDKRKVTESRENGQVKEIKVETGKTTYYINPNEQVGNAQPGDAQSMTNHGVKFKVMEFDLGKKTPKGDGEVDMAPSHDTPPDSPPTK